MTAIEFYTKFRRAMSNEIGTDFDRHVLACIFSISASEFVLHETLAVSFSVQDPDILAWLKNTFADSLSPDLKNTFDATPVISAEEQSLRDLLMRFRTRRSSCETLLAMLIARRAQRANHLWQDLGLQNRGELSQLMTSHFSALARRNKQDMKWKKFFFRMICTEEGSRLCSAPSCHECVDIHACFGDESGESAFARSLRLNPSVNISLPVLA